MMAHRLPDRLKPGQYACSLCGIVHEYSGPSRRRDTCADCERREKDLRFLTLLEQGMDRTTAATTAGIGRTYARLLAEDVA